MRVLYFTLLLLSVVGRPVQAEPQIQCEGEEENLQTYLQMHDILFTQRDTSRVRDFYAESIISHNNDRGGGAEKRVTNPDAMAAMWDRSRELDPGRVLEDELILCVGDFVVVRTLMKSHFVFPLAGVEPTGEAYEMTATDIYRFEDGKVVERWGNNDMANVYEQLEFKITSE